MLCIKFTGSRKVPYKLDEQDTQKEYSEFYNFPLLFVHLSVAREKQ